MSLLVHVCPRCKQGALFASFLTVAPVCGACGLKLSEYDLGDGPAFFGIVLVGALACAGAIMLELSAAPPLWVHVALWPPVVVLASMLALRGLKAWLLVMHYRFKQGRHD